MPLPISDEPLADSRVYLDQALEAEKGIKITCASPKEAWRLRMRCYSTRDRARRQSTKIYAMNHPNYGKTPYDGLTLWIETQAGERVPNNDTSHGNVVVISKILPTDVRVEEIK